MQIKQQALDCSALQLELLKSLEPQDVCSTLVQILNRICQPQAVAVLLWDADFESFGENHKYLFGSAQDVLSLHVEELYEDGFDWSVGCTVLNAGNDKQKAQLHIAAYPVVSEGTPVAAVLLAVEGKLDAATLEQELARYPLALALSNCWEVAELKREVERLREQYEQLEFDLQEERRQAAINGGVATANPATVRLEQTDKEKLVYEISNAVRSSLDVQEVLQTAVNKIGATFKLSRCLVLWPMPDSDEYTVYEFYDDGVPAVKDLFFTPAGENFVRRASSTTAPHDFIDVSEQEAFDKAFLQKFGFLSGMLVPLMYGERNIGSLFLQDCVTPREWSIDNTALIGSLADLVTVAIEHANMHEEKKRQAVTDGLTGIANRRHFNETFEKEFERARRYGTQLSLVMFDLDYLKKINDTYGHHVGDEAIKLIGEILARSCRAVDLAARFGGEEFCLLLPATDATDAIALAERIRKSIENTSVEGPGNISASIGVATYPEHCSEAPELFEAADQALYAAKQGGRNRVMCASALKA